MNKDYVPSFPQDTWSQHTNCTYDDSREVGVCDVRPTPVVYSLVFIVIAVVLVIAYLYEKRKTVKPDEEN